MPSSHGATLPQAGLPIRGSSHRGPSTRRAQKADLWSAVAMQQHLLLSGAIAHNDIQHSTAVLPPAQPHGRMTLAQKMGLVPAPPPAPSEEDWRGVETRALLREAYDKPRTNPVGGGQVCSICREPFRHTLNQGQIILSCSHVFHERCFQQFERFTRLQMRAEGASTLTRLACPECRQTHYHKRTFFAGKAMAQRAALVRVQAVIRGFLVRRQYTRQRLQQDRHFRDSYVQLRLAKLSAAWEEHLATQAKTREAVLEQLEVRQQEAAAAYLTEEDWEAIVAKRVEADMSTRRRAAATAVAGTSSLLVRSSPPTLCDESMCVHECPICLERIERGGASSPPPLRGSNRNDAGSCQCDTPAGAAAVSGVKGAATSTAADSLIAQWRQEYDQRRADPQQRAGMAAKPVGSTVAKPTGRRPLPKGQRAKCDSTAASLSQGERTRRAQHQHHQDQRTTKPKAPATWKASTASPIHVREAAVTNVEAAASETAATNDGSGSAAPHASLRINSRPGTILSCGHAFHAACLTCFERYNEWRATEADGADSVLVLRRCPLCRAGYGKHSF